MASTAAETSLTRALPRLDVDRPEAVLLPHGDQPTAQQLEHRDERDHRLQAVLGLQDELYQLDRTAAQPVAHEVQLLLQRPGAAGDDHGPWRDAGEHAVESNHQEPDFEGLLLAARLDGTRGRREGERLLQAALHQLSRHLLVDAILLEALAHLL